MNRQSLDAIRIAKRVLAARAEERDPDARDLDKLRRIAPPLADLPPEELATKVILLANSISGSHKPVPPELPPHSVRRPRKEIGPLSRRELQ